MTMPDTRPTLADRPASRLASALVALALLVACAAAAVAGGVDPPRAPAGPEAHFFLSWNAPHGSPSARENLTVACGPGGAVDTLFLCFDPVRDTSSIVGMTATLRIWPAGGDTLSSHWRFDKQAANGRLRVEFSPDSVPGTERPWSVEGFGGMRYRSMPGGATMRLIQAVPRTGRALVHGGRLYVFARVLVPRPPAGEACERPLCVEWESGSLAYGERNEPVSRRGSRFVSWRSPGAAVCASYRKFSGADPWRPPGTPGR